MNDLPPLNRLYRAYDRYEQDINTPGARHNLPIDFVVRVSEELSEQATLIAHWRGRYEEARKALNTVEAELYDFRVELEVTTLEAKVEEVQNGNAPMEANTQSSL